MATLPQKIGKYVVERELGRGGMGVVYHAVDPVIERPVALKIVIKSLLDPADAPSLLERFKREARAAGRLLHPNIVSVYEYGEDDDRAYIAMEFVAGRGLNEFLAPGKPLAPERARPVVAQLLGALQFAHAQGVVHRDIKPANVIMTADWRAKVADFGIAQLDSTKLTQLGTVIGTPSYMSPEQFRGEPTDMRADIFSAGVTIYEILTGRKPFSGHTLWALAKSVLNGQPVAPTEANPALDAAFDPVLLKALAVDPADRFANAGDFARALEAAFARTVPLAPIAALPARAPATPASMRKIDFSAITRKIDAASIHTPSPGADPLSPRTLLPRVLFVDDEERILSALKLLFRQQFDVHVTTNPAQALEWLGKQHFHVLVSDQRMPDMNGTELLSKARHASPNTVRILLTGYSDLAAIIGSINEGEVYRFASKPWNTQEMRTLLAEATAIGLALEDAPPAAVGTDRPEEAVLIVDEDREIYLAARDLFGANYRVLHATDLFTALEVLRGEQVGVLVADIEGGQQDNRTLFKMLKREHPQILTIAMTAASDSDLVIDLINKAQIFRFLNKPLKLLTLQMHVAAAMAQFLKYKAQPKLLLRQKVDKPAEPEQSSVGQMILGTLRALRARLSTG